MKLTYDRYYRLVGIINPNKLGNQKVSSAIAIDLPQGSALHYVGPSADGAVMGMNTDSEYTKNKAHQVVVLFEHKFSRLDPRTALPEGAVALKRNSLFPVENEYFQTHQRFKNMRRNQNLVMEKNNLVVYDYTLLPRTVVYRENRYTFWHKWKNMSLSVIDSINNLSANSTRQHFIEIDVPTTVPPLSMWNLVDQDFSGDPKNGEGVQLRTELWKAFNDYDMLTLMDLWIWLGTYRNKSNFSQLTELARSKTNIIFRAGGGYSVIALDLLDKWLMKAGDNSKEARLPGRVAKYRLLGTLMRLNKLRSSVLEEEDTEIIDNDDQTQYDDDESGKSPAKGKRDITEVFGDLAPAVRRLDIDMKRTQNSTADDVKVEVKAAGLTPQEQVPVKPTDLGDVVKQDSVDETEEQMFVDLTDDEILKDLEQLEYTYKQREINEAYGSDYEAYIPPSIDPEDAIYEAATRATGKSLLSEAELRRLVRKSGNYKRIPNPYGTDAETFSDAINITDEDLVISEKTPLAESILGVTDQSMLSSSLGKMNSQYIRNTYHKDIGNVFLSLQQAGIIVDDYNIEHVENFTDSYDVHKVRIIPVRGQPSTLNIRIPTIREDGTFYAGGVRYRMRTQRGDLPIRKTAPNKVSMTSYFSKMFVTRSERAVFNYTSWITRKLIELGWSADPIVSDLILANVSTREYAGSRTYSSVATRIKSFVSKGYFFSFDLANIAEVFPSRVKDTSVTPVASDPSGRMLYIDNESNELIQFTNGQKQSMGTLEAWVGLDTNAAPLDIAEIKLFGKSIPLGIILAHHTGLGSLMKTLGTTYRVVKKGSNLSMQPHEYCIKFEDETLVFDRRQRISTLLLGGFNRYHQHIKQHSRYAFDKRDVYGVIFENVGVGSRKTREVDFMFKMWIDHITRGLLVEMGMPTDLFNLFIEACKMLVNDAYHEEIDVAQMRDKGYERISGMLYEEILASVKAFNNRPNALNASVQVNPLAVWMKIQVDQSVTAVDESNPIQSLKDLEVVVFRGQGGRSSVSMTAPTRVFHRNGMGVTSEATVDNGDVGTISFTSADPNYTSVRGRTRRLENIAENTAKVISTSMLLAPGSDMDDQLVRQLNVETHLIDGDSLRASYTKLVTENI